jgi:ketosteroid isomerase-like protein
MGEHPNAAIFRSLIDAFNTGDIDTIIAVIDDNVVWHTMGGADPTMGAAALAENALSFPEGVDITAVVHDVVANDDHVVGLISATVTTGDQTFEYNTAEILHFSNGKVTERWAFSDDTARIGEFFSQFG